MSKENSVFKLLHGVCHVCKKKFFWTGPKEEVPNCRCGANNVKDFSRKEE